MFEVDVQYINHRITFKVYEHDKFKDISDRAQYVLDYEAGKTIALLPIEDDFAGE